MNNKNEFEIITYCSLNNQKNDFDVDKCGEGDLGFKVPTEWLISKINSDKSFIPFGSNGLEKIENLKDLEKWSTYYTHHEGELLYRAALEENKIIGAPVVLGCNYCK